MAGDLADKAFVQGDNGSNDIRATNDTDGSYLFARGGDDTLRGGRYDDVLTGGAGNDTYFGGAGADQFRFFGYDVADGGDLDKIFDLTFGEGDLLVFGSYAAGTFSDAAGENADASGSGAIISSFQGLANAIDGSALISYSQKGTTDVLILTIDNGSGGIQTIHITGAYAAVAAFNPDAMG